MLKINAFVSKNYIKIIKLFIVFFLIFIIGLLFLLKFLTTVDLPNSQLLSNNNFKSEKDSRYLLKLNFNNNESDLFVTKEKYNLSFYKYFYGQIKILSVRNIKTNQTTTILNWVITKNNRINISLLNYIGFSDPANFPNDSSSYIYNGNYFKFSRSEPLNNDLSKFFIYGFNLSDNGYLGLKFINIKDSIINIYLSHS